MRQWAFLLALITACTCDVVAAENKAPKQIPPKLVELVKGPERVEIPCKLKIRKPFFMFQQQYLVVVRGLFPHKIVDRGDLQHIQLLIKAQDERGHWIDGGDFEDFKVPENITGKDIEYFAGMYFRPGTYRISVVVYDSVANKANVYHRIVRIPPLKEDPLPGFDALLPEVEFTGLTGAELWPVSQKLKRIRVENSRPARLEVVLNVSKRSRSGWLYRNDMQRALQTASVVGHMQMANGCVRVSVIDMMRMNVVVDRKSADDLDWGKLQEEVEKLDQNTIDISVLENQRKIATFTHDFLRTLAGDTGGCGKSNEPAEPFIAVISHDFVFPDGAKIARVTDIDRSQFFYLHHGIGGSWMDAMGQILNSANTEKIRCFSPKELRKAIARISSRIAEQRESH